MNEVLRRTGIVFLLTLYSLSISTIGFSHSTGNSSKHFSVAEETIQDVLSTVINDHSHQLDLRIVSNKEKSESSVFSDYPFWQQAFSCSLPFHSLRLNEVIVPKDEIPLQFAQTDIIFPFHYFF